MSKQAQRAGIGSQLKEERKKQGKGFNDIPMNYRTVKNIEEGETSYDVDNLLQYMEELQLSSISISTKIN